MPGVACPPGGPVGLRSPPAPVLGAAQTAILPLSGHGACRARPDPWLASVGAWGPPRARDLGAAPRPRQGLWSPGPPLRESGTETWDSPTFPRDPCADMPRAETPVVSRVLALSHPGLRPSGPWNPSAVLSVPPCEFALCPRLYPFRGAMPRPVSLLPPASYAHGGVCTWMGLLTCWRGVDQGGLEPSPVLTHWVTPTNCMSLRPIPRFRASLGATSAGLGVEDGRDMGCTRLLHGPEACSAIPSTPASTR
jgi:hypothetical protein